MSNSLYTQAKEAFLGADIDLPADDIRAVLVDLADYGVAVTGATNATPIEITATGHGVSTGAQVVITGVAGNTAANGKWTITSTGANTFTLTGSVGSGAYTSGGRVIKIDTDEFLSDLPAGARVAVSTALAGKTITNGVFNATNHTVLSVSGDTVEAVVLYKHTGVEGTSNLINFQDTTPGSVAIAQTPDGGNVLLTWDTGANKIFRL